MLLFVDSPGYRLLFYYCVRSLLLQLAVTLDGQQAEAWLCVADCSENIFSFW